MVWISILESSDIIDNMKNSIVYKFLLALSLLFLSVSLSAQQVNDVDDMGDIWVITIDKSGSMLNVRRSEIQKRVRDAFQKKGTLKDVDYSKDRFIFYNAGITTGPNDKIASQLGSAKRWTDSFIHDVTKFGNNLLLFKTNGQECLMACLDALILSDDYIYQRSFVSQIGLFSVVKANNLLKREGISASYNRIHVVVITDDADMDDQWMIDEKDIRKYAPNLWSQATDTTSTYLTKRVNGVPIVSGTLRYDSEKSDSLCMPRVFCYDYYTEEQRHDTFVDERNQLFNVIARDGKSITFKKRLESYDNSPITLIKIDSINVNGNSYPVALSGDSLSVSVNYPNGLYFNNIRAIGSLQYLHTDKILGPHYEKVPFVFETKAKTGLQATIMTILAILLALAILWSLVYYLILRPNKEIVTIYSGLGFKTKVKRGFVSNWKDETTALQLYQKGESGIASVITRKGNNIKTEKITVTDVPSSEILLCSPYELNLSCEAKQHSTLEDIVGIYSTRTGNYPALLKVVYESTAIAKLWNAYNESDTNREDKKARFKIKLHNLFHKRYYYSIKDITTLENICFESPDLLQDKRFLLEVSPETTQKVKENDDYYKLSSKALYAYYNNLNLEYSNTIICMETCSDHTVWSVLLLDKDDSLNKSLGRLNSILRFVQEGNSDLRTCSNKIKNYLENTIKGCKSVLVAVNQASESSPVDFEIINSTAPAFVSFVEASDEKKSQTLYSPIVDGKKQSKFIGLNSKLGDGHLYLSLLPYELCKSVPQLTIQISRTVIYTENKSTSVLSVNNGKLSFRDIVENI